MYPKCQSGFHAVGCCVCSPTCPDGMNDIGISCGKNSYGRGVGVSPVYNAQMIRKKKPLYVIINVKVVGME